MNRYLTRSLMWLRSLVRRRAVETDLSEELRFHLERDIDERIARGVPPADARRAARAALGGVEPLKEACRDARGTRAIEDTLQDLRYGLRLLRRSPAFTSVAVLSLALGIGANTAIFTLVDAVLVRTLPVPRPHELVLLSHNGEGRPVSVYSRDQVAALRAERAVLADLAALRAATIRVTIDGVARAVPGQVVSGSYYAVLGLRAQRGRLLSEADDRIPGGHPVAVISDGYWRRQFGADPATVGRILDVDGQPFTIIGITPPGFFGTEPGKAVDLTLPLSMQAAAGWRLLPQARWLRTLGRLAPGVPVETAQARLAVVWDRLSRGPNERPSPNAQPLALLSGARGLNELRRQFSLPLRVLMATVVLVLLLACANLASLLLARAAARRPEIELRRALGASRGRLLRQAMTESLLLATLGAAAGTLLAAWGVRLLIAMMARGSEAIVLDLTPNPRTLAFTLGVSVMTGLLFGLAPALRATRVDPSASGATPSLRGGGRTIAGGRTSWTPVMIAAQTALCLLLLSGAALFLRTLVNLRDTEGGYRREPVLFARLRSSLPDRPEAQAAGASPRAIFQQVLARLAQMPGVASATLTMDTPAAGGMSWGTGLSVPGRAPEPRDEAGVWVNHVGPRFFETVGIPLVAGRDVQETDDERAGQVGIVGERLARHYFGDQDPLGRTVIVDKVLVQIVGVARDVKYMDLRAEAPAVLYRPYLQRPPNAANAKDWRLGELQIAIRTREGEAAAAPAALRDGLRAVLRETAPGVEATRLARLDEQVDAMLVRERMMSTLSLFFGALALLLACIGLYGTLASAVVRRTREIGVRLALGASRGGVGWMIVRQALPPVIAGLAVGLAAALAGGRLVGRLLFELAPTDPVSHAGAIAVLLACAAGAAWLPARRAARIEPVAALRADER